MLLELQILLQETLARYPAMQFAGTPVFVESPFINQLKTLPCGTLVKLRYGGRSVSVPVVDRGPYVAGREFDLTQATKQALGFGDTGEVWSTR